MQLQKLVFNIFTFLSPLLLDAQKTLVLEGTVIDEANKVTLAYVNIGVVGTKLGTIANQNGAFQLYFEAGMDEEQIVRFSHLGYEAKDFTVASLRLLNGQAIRLKKIGITLATVEVRPTLSATKIIGHEKINTSRVTNFSIAKKPNQNLGAAIGRRFNIGNKASQLAAFSFYIGGNDFDTTRFRVNIYNIKNGRPHQLLNRANIVTTVVDQRRGWVRVDLTSQQIFVKKDVVVAIEWIEHSQKGRILKLPITMPSFGTHFYKYGSQDKWKRFRGMSTAMTLTVKH
ncbi:MAG: carboxypeptidase-like regulatory domain-containing protein [Bacteroidota bacterium]